MSMKSTRFTDPSVGGRTRQSEAAACDVNLIIAAHRRGAVTTHIQQRVGEYGFVPAATFQDCMNEVKKAEAVFAELPAATREFFSNDPARFVDYCSRPENQAELVKMKLAVPREKPPEPVIQKVEIVNPQGANISAPKA